jgi:peptidoglycan hydrolase-like protein with peptidoglycan-binding domain
LKRLQNAIHVAAGALLFAGSFGLVSSVGFAQSQTAKPPVTKSAAPSTKAPASGASHSSTTGHTTKTGSKKKSAGSKSSRVKMQTAPTADRIRDIQSALSKAGAYDGEPTGAWDARTAASMQKFQQSNGLSPTGKLDALTLQKLGLGSDTAGKGAPRPAATPTATASTTPGNHR